MSTYSIVNDLEKVKHLFNTCGLDIGSKVFMIPTQNNGLPRILCYSILSVGISRLGVRIHLSLNDNCSGVEKLYCSSIDMYGVSIFKTMSSAINNA